MSLLALDVCVVCFHDGHPDGPCKGMDPAPDGEFVCGCVEYVTEEERGQIVVEVRTD